MGEKKTNPVTIDGVEYIVEDMTQEQQALLNHVIDLERKLNSARFSTDQLQVGRDAFFAMLKKSLDTVTDVEAK
jgi:hypothetical protein